LNRDRRAFILAYDKGRQGRGERERRERGERPEGVIVQYSKGRRTMISTRGDNEDADNDGLDGQ
jgi:hypothetical protein